MKTLVDGTRIRVEDSRVRDGGYLCSMCGEWKGLAGYHIHVSSAGVEYLGTRCKRCEGDVRNTKNRMNRAGRRLEREMMEMITQVFVKTFDGQYIKLTEMTRARIEDLLWEKRVIV